MNISPEDFLMLCVGLVNANPTAYPDWSERELRDHFVSRILNRSMQVRVEDERLTGLCTWVVHEENKTIHLVGLIGDLRFVRFMRDRWLTELPDYSVVMHRRGKFRKFAEV